MAIPLLDKRKIKYWDSMDKTLSDIFRVEGIEDFLEEVSCAQVPDSDSDSDWGSMPLYMLVDYLTQEHRNFQVQEISDITHLLDIFALADSEEAVDLRKIQKSFQTWVEAFKAHIEEEENFLFPKVLRYEACLRDHKVDPEFHRGSIQAYVGSREVHDSRRFYSECGEVARNMRLHEAAYPESHAAFELAKLAESLRDKMNIHFDLESRTLYKAGQEMERNLYNKSIGGDPSVVGQTNGLMRPGIFRVNEN